MTPSDPRPRLAASLACFRDGEVLIARRGRAPNRGVWSLPGGGVEFGETGAEAAAREFFEETGARAEVLGLVDVVEVLRPAEGETAAFHAVILAYSGRLVSGEPAPTEEAEEVAWVRPEALGAYEATPGLGAVVRKAAEIAA